jgi:hypothetical protein
VEAALALAGAVDDCAPEADVEAVCDELPSVPEEAPEFPPRKSVTYHPEPLSWKPAAVTCLRKVSAPHRGQCVSTGSEIFWSTSCPCPQDSHL